MNDRERIGHMIHYARLAVSFVQEQDEMDDVLFYALSRALGIIGEAALHVSQETRLAHPQIDWNRTIELRDWVTHRYNEVKPEPLREAVETELPELIAQLEQIV